MSHPNDITLRLHFDYDHARLLLAQFEHYANRPFNVEAIDQLLDSIRDECIDFELCQAGHADPAGDLITAENSQYSGSLNLTDPA